MPTLTHAQPSRIAPVPALIVKSGCTLTNSSSSAARSLGGGQSEVKADIVRVGRSLVGLQLGGSAWLPRQRSRLRANALRLDLERTGADERLFAALCRTEEMKDGLRVGTSLWRRSSESCPRARRLPRLCRRGRTDDGQSLVIRWLSDLGTRRPAPAHIALPIDSTPCSRSITS